MQFEWDSLAVPHVQAWAELTNLLAKVDGTEEFYSADDLAEELAEPGVDPALDTVAVFADGTLIAFGQLRVNEEPSAGHALAWLLGGVHPDHRGAGIGRQIMDRLERRAATLAGQRLPGRPLRIKVAGGLAGASIRPMLEHRGYRIVRYFHEMQRPLPGPPIAVPAQSVQPYRAELAEQVRLAHNDAFSTHWDSTPRSAETWQAQLASRTLRAEASFVSTAADGSVAAYVLARQWTDGELWVDLVGSRQSARGQGLARACLSASLRAAGEQGYRSAALSVDSENGQGAGRLYSSLGFEVVRVVAMYAKVFTG